MQHVVHGTEPLVSIICTAYNQEKYIRNCLDGFLMQKTDFPYEIIVHDDASTDHTAEIIREYERKHPECIRAIYQTENQYSQGIRIVQTYIYPKTRGKFIAYCEGDDYWTDPLKLAKQVNALYAHPDCRLCLHKVEDVSEDGIPIGISCPKEHLPTSVMSSEQFIGKNGDFFQLSSYLHYREDLLPFYSDWPEFYRISDVGDKPLLLYLGQLGNVYYIDEAMSCYRQDSVCSWTSKLKTGTREKILLHLETTVAVYKEFDLFSKGRFSETLQPMLLQAEYTAAKNRYPFREPLKRNYRVLFRQESLKNRLRIILCAVFPNVFPKLLSLREQKKRRHK